MNNKFSYYVQLFFKDYLPTSRNFSHNTILTYKYAFINFIEYLKIKEINIEELEITKISYELVEGFIIWLKDKKELSEKTINVIMASIKSFINFLSTKNLSNFEVCLKIKNMKPLKEEKKLPKFYSIEEITFLLKSIDSSRKNGLKFLAVISILYDGALRVSELCNLKRKNINTSTKNISVHIEKTKNKMERIILLDENSSKIIKQYLKENNINDEEYLFSNSRNEKYTRDGIYKMIKRVFEKAKNNCEDPTYFKTNAFPHILRHSKATHMLDAGIDLIVIRDFLGHKWLNSTEKYAHVSKKKQEEALIKTSKKLKIRVSRSRKEKEDLESWLHNNI